MSARTRSAGLVLVTCANEDQAVAIARELVEERLAACANLISSVRSIYRWHDKIEDDREVLLLVKTRLALLKKLERRVRELHTYEVPEVTALRFTDGSAKYVQWLLDATKPKVAGRRASK
jgi:periplasmic divalent cation tolerance protein